MIHDRKIMLRIFWAIILIVSLTIMTLMLEGCSRLNKEKEVRIYNVDSLDCN